MTNDSGVTILKTDKTIDCSGKLCPLPVVELSKDIKTIEVGQVLVIIATDAGSPPEYANIKRVNIGLARADGQRALELKVGRNVCALTTAYHQPVVPVPG